MRSQILLVAASLATLCVSLTPSLAQNQGATLICTECTSTGGDASCSKGTEQKSKLGTRGAQRHRQHAVDRIKAIKSLPSLTAEQSNQIDTILASFKEEVKPLREQVKALRKGANSTAISSSTESSGNQVSEIKAELKSKMRTTLSKISDVLTTEQKSQLKSMRKARTTAEQG